MLGKSAAISFLTDRKYRPIITLVLVGLILRLPGITYGMPLWLVGDEPSLIFGALKMIELKTVIPALHDAAFKGLFYYAPYIAYTYLIPFAAIIGLKWLAFAGTFDQFRHWLSIDLTSFFVAARLISVALGTVTVVLLYKIAEAILPDRRAAFLSALFLAGSVLHVIFSHWARHWVPATFFFCLIWFILTRDWPVARRYVMAATFAGIGAGVSLQVALATVFMVLWFFSVDRRHVGKAFRSPWLYQSILIFFVLTMAAYLLWPRGFYVAAGATRAVASAKSWGGFFNSFIFYFLDILRREPTFLAAASIGLVAAWRRRRDFAVVATIFIVVYITIFYLVFVQVSRFALLFYPVLAVLAGYGIWYVASQIRFRYAMHSASFLFLLPLLASSFYFDWLLVKNDTRNQVVNWASRHIPPGSKIVVLAPLLRLPTNQAALSEQVAIDPNSIRTIDRAEQVVPDNLLLSPRFHALNLNAVISSTFFADLPRYLRQYRYEYIIINQRFAADKGASAALTVASNENKIPSAMEWGGLSGEPQAFFQGYQGNPLGYLPSDGTIQLGELFVSPRLGPDIWVMRIK